ncbi:MULTISPECIES: PLP-dependent lyase/thiolase [unclassified Nocardia]|uniref:PLP-dependent lyase/thiolase n=1 Tax=unclassified Nocardia TaxID=2637762 RepID=UPI001CE3EA98|nr:MULTISPECIES: PLP-dependent lyase/thiolase [unclassified Nocardia]
MTVSINTSLTALRCICCARDYDPGHYPSGCPDCLRAGTPSNLHCVYDSADMQFPLVDPVTLGAGATPLYRLSEGLGLGANGWVKDESRNPTGSHKDRFALGAVGWAKAAGFDTIFAASSGNAALAVAAYCAANDVQGVIAMTSDVPPPLAERVSALGAEVRMFETYDARWEFVARHCASGRAFNATNFTVPVVGCSPFGIEYFKTIAQEIVADLGSCPDAVVIPSSRGDLAHGIYRGFIELGGGVPRLYLVEPFPRLRAVLEAGADWRTSFPGETELLNSIAGDSTTQQSIAAAAGSGGGAVVVPDPVAAQWHRRMWSAGYCWETSSNAAFAAMALLRQQGRVRPAETTVVVATAHGFKGL